MRGRPKGSGEDLTRRTACAMPPELDVAMRGRARELGVSISEVIRTALTLYLEGALGVCEREDVPS